MADEQSGGEVVPAAQLRASHQDRDRVVEVLRVAAGDGRLTAEELDDRLERALAARTYAELAVLTNDLPASPEAALGTAQPKEIIKINCGSGHAKREGRWIVPHKMDVKVTSGHVVLDFTDAEIVTPVLEVTAEVRSGHLLMITKPGIVVDTDDVTVRSGHVKVRAPWGPEVPVRLRITVSGRIRSGHLLARPPRRNFWEWLTRAPKRYAISASLSAAGAPATTRCRPASSPATSSKPASPSSSATGSVQLPVAACSSPSSSGPALATR